MNEFEFVSPVKTLAQSLTNLTETLPENERYSFNFQGNSQSLDHILVSDNLASKAKFDIVHVNSEFAETTQRASDHDPLVASLNISSQKNQTMSNLAGTIKLEGAEISAYDSATKRIFVTGEAGENNVNRIVEGSPILQAVDVSDPSKPKVINQIDLSRYGAGVQSVAVKNGLVAVAVSAEISTDPGKVVFFNASDYSELSQVTVGALPDMLTFTPDGSKVLVANEGEPNDRFTVDPEGSVSIINVSDISNPTVTTADFSAFNGQEDILRSQGVRIFGQKTNADGTKTPSTAAEDFEPEYIAVSPDGKSAFVTLQENNAFAVVDVEQGQVTSILPLGYKDWSGANPTLKPFKATLEGSQEVTPNATEATANALLQLNQAGDALSYTMTVSGLDFGKLAGGAAQTADTSDDVTGIHFHNAARGANSPVVFGIFGPAQDTDDRTITINPNGTTTISGVWETTDTAANQSLSDFVANLKAANQDADTNLYLNIHTEKFPMGEIRGQIAGSSVQLDASDKDGGINFKNYPNLFGIYQPDAVASYTANGQTYYIIANEGDARIRPDGDIEDAQGNVLVKEGVDFNEEARVKDVTLDPIAFPNAAELQKNENLGRLKITNTMGDTDRDGDYDQLFAYGGRSFSIFDSSGKIVYDSGDLIGKLTSQLVPEKFNSQGSAGSFDERSDDKGAEPEGVTIGKVGNRTYAYVGLERTSGVMVFDVSNPTAASFVQYLDNAADVGPEGLTFIDSQNSPNSKSLLAVTNEVSNTLSLYNSNVPEPTVTNYTFNNLPKLGTTSTNQDIFLGGFSGLYFQGTAANGNLKFVTNTDRGPNGEPTDGKRPFFLPSFQPEVVSFELNRPTGQITITNRTGLFRKDGTTPLTGLPNLQAGAVNTAYTDEIGVDSSGNTVANDTLGADLEGIVVDRDGSYWMVDEYRPAIYHFENNGKLIDRYIPQGSPTDSSQNGGTSFGTPVLPAVYAQRRANRGFEAVALEGNKLYAFIQSAIDNPDNGNDTASRGSRNLRILEFDTVSKQVTGEYLYLLDSITGTGNAKTDKIGDAVALGNGKFAVVERDDLSTTASNKLIYSIDLAKATNINNPANFTLPAGKTIEQLTPEELTTANIKPVSKSLIANAAQSGYTGVEKLEGLALVAPNTLALINDNDFNSNVPEQLGILELPNDLPVTINQKFTLQLLHAADQEAGIPALDDAPRFSAVLNALKNQDANNDGKVDYENTLLLSSGDAYIPGLFLNAAEDPSLAPLLGKEGKGRADIIIQNELGFQAIAFGNHEFDLGTGLIKSVLSPDGAYPGANFPYLSSNLDFTNNADLAALVAADGQEASTIPGKIAKSTVVTVNGEKIGVVGATTPTLPRISSPGTVGVLPADTDINALAAEIQKSVDALLTAKPDINKVILLAHMQQIAIEQELAGLLKNVDIIMAGGSNTRLLDDTDRLRAGDTKQGVYPILKKSASGEDVAVINTDGNYKYVGRLVVDFDAQGRIIPQSINPDVSGAYATDDQGVADLNAQNLVDPEIKAITDALREVIQEQDGNVLGITNVFLNGTRSDVRTQETNLGNLTADANLNYVKGLDATTVISIKNGGGIRDNIGRIFTPAGATESQKLPPEGNELSGKPDGGISQPDAQNALSFNNALTLVTLTAEQLKQVLEHGVAATADGATPGQFPQIGGVSFSFDATKPVGQRIQSAAILNDDGTVKEALVRNGQVVGDANRGIRITTLGFLADGGDNYPFADFIKANPTFANRVDLLGETDTDLNFNGKIDAAVDPAKFDPGKSNFANSGTEQDAFAEYLLANFNTPETAFKVADVAPAEDMRIQNLASRADTVLAGLMQPPVVEPPVVQPPVVQPPVVQPPVVQPPVLENIIIGTNVNGTTVESINLTGLTGQKTVNFTISREANFNNEVYFYAVDDITGTVGGVKVGDAGYVKAALNNRVSPVFSTSDDNTQTGSAQFTAGSIVVPVIIADGTLAQALSGAAEVYFPYLGANTDNKTFDHIKFVGDNTFGFEDLANGGDKDFNDIVIKINSIA